MSAHPVTYSDVRYFTAWCERGEIVVTYKHPEEPQVSRIRHNPRSSINRCYGEHHALMDLMSISGHLYGWMLHSRLLDKELGWS